MNAWTLVARVVLGGLYVVMGAAKAADPVAFLKLVRQYEMVDSAVGLNVVAAALPWFEVGCGVLLIAGVAVRGTALLSLGMLIPFTLVVWKRALVLQEAGHLPFCAVRFDCGCGAGVVAICHKLLENAALMALSGWLLVGPRSRWAIRPELFGSASPPPVRPPIPEGPVRD